MCFRPTSISKPVECPNCGKKISALSGVMPKRCPYCKEPLPEEQVECPKCGTMNPKSANACSGCGVTVAEIKAKANKLVKCPQCDASNRGLDKTCSKCGAELPW